MPCSPPPRPPRRSMSDRAAKLPVVGWGIHMGRNTKNRGGLSAAFDVVEKRLRAVGVVRARDFEPVLNSHNWLNIFPFNLREAAPHLFVADTNCVSVTALAASRFRSAVVGLESALFLWR